MAVYGEGVDNFLYPSLPLTGRPARAFLGAIHYHLKIYSLYWSPHHFPPLFSQIKVAWINSDIIHTEKAKKSVLAEKNLLCEHSNALLVFCFCCSIWHLIFVIHEKCYIRSDKKAHTEHYFFPFHGQQWVLKTSIKAGTQKSSSSAHSFAPSQHSAIGSLNISWAKKCIWRTVIDDLWTHFCLLPLQHPPSISTL